MQKKNTPKNQNPKNQPGTHLPGSVELVYVVDQVAGERRVVRNAASISEGHQDTQDGHGRPHLGYRTGHSTCSQIWASLETFPKRARTASKDLPEGPSQQHVGA